MQHIAKEEQRLKAQTNKHKNTQNNNIHKILLINPKKQKHINKQVIKTNNKIL